MKSLRFFLKSICIFVVLITIGLTSIGQNRQIDILSTKYDKIKASRVIKTTKSMKLNGNIKSIKVIDLASKDTCFFKFADNGLLMLSIETNPSSSSKIGITKEYSFDKNSLLKQLHIENKNLRSITDQKFNDDGFLVNEETKSKTQDGNYHQLAKYNYSDSNSKVIVNYSYPIANQNGDNILQEIISFFFDIKGRLMRERIETKMTEWEFGSNTIINYDPVLNLPKDISHRDDCAGSNSCLNLILAIQYDERGNIITESMSDFTIRNALWSYSYNFRAKYNLNNDLIEEYQSENEHEYHFDISGLPTSTTKNYDQNKTVYQYDYDTNGNWINKYAMNKDQRVLNSKRLIEYYDIPSK